MGSGVRWGSGVGHRRWMGKQGEGVSREAAQVGIGRGAEEGGVGGGCLTRL